MATKQASYLMGEGAKNATSGAIMNAAETAKNNPKMNGDKCLDNLRTSFMKGVGLAVMDVLEISKGLMNAKALDKKLEAQLFSPKEQKIMAAMIAKQASKAILKSAK